MRKPSRSLVMTVAASTLVSCVTVAIGFAVSVAPIGEAFAAKKDEKKRPSKQETKKSEPYPVNDDVDDPAVWGKVFPLYYELYLKSVDMQRTKHGGSEAMPHTPTKADPRSVVARSKVEEDPGLKAMWQG
jgi:nitrite reductase (cytochrome c-552)